MMTWRSISLFVLSALLLILTLIPCADTIESTGINLTESQWVQQDIHQEVGDFCTPFCVCNCCASPILVQTTASFALISELKAYSAPANSYQFLHSDFNTNIWQPPRIV